MNDDDLRSELVLASGEESARLPDIPRDVLRALHAAVLGKKEILSLSKHRQALIDLNDIEQICHILAQWSSQYDPISRRLEISATHLSDEREKKKYRYKFSSLESFKKYDVGTKDPIVKLDLYFTMISKHPESEVLQPIELTLDFVGLYDHPHYYLRNGRATHYKFDPSEISCGIRVEYVDYIVCKSLLSVVEDWYDGLEEVEYKAMSRWWRLLRFSYGESALDASFLVSWVPVLFGTLIAIGLARNTSLGGMPPSSEFFFYFLVFSFFSSLLFRLIMSLFEEKIYYDSTIPLIRMNKGNEKQASEYEKRKKTAQNARSLLLFGVGLAFVSNS